MQAYNQLDKGRYRPSCMHDMTHSCEVPQGLHQLTLLAATPATVVE